MQRKGKKGEKRLRERPVKKIKETKERYKTEGFRNERILNDKDGL